jgi:hypothetical protein
MWTATAAIVVCLVIDGMAALAQAPSESPAPVMPAGPATVTGEVSCSMYPCDFHRLSDPRVAGDALFEQGGIWDGDHAATGTITLTGPDGDWIGPGIWVLNEDLDAWVMIWTLEGTGAYEGWAFVYTVNEPGTGEYNPTHGYIYEGSAPRMEWPEPSPATE